MTTARSLLRNFSFLLFLVVIIGYAGFEMRSFLRGPTLTIETPQNGETISSSLTLIRGKAANITFLFLNGRQIYTDERGVFEEYILLPRGYNRVTIEGTGKFGKSITRQLDLISS